jgi:hypothetical protein
VSVFEGGQTPDPRQQFRSALGTAPGTPGPLGAPLPDQGPAPDLGAPRAAIEIPGAPPAGLDSEVDVLKSLITIIGDYKSLGSVTEKERAEIGKAEQIVQRLLAQNERLGESATGTKAGTRKLFA